jgi:tryptophan-rich sensory protein
VKTLWYVLLCQAVGIGSALATRRGLVDWYPALKKPWFNPPNRVFGPVWTVLYLLMAVAGAMVHDDPTCRAFFGLQLTLNGLWSLVFFGWRRPGLALLNIAMLWASIAVCVVQFAAVDPWAGRLFWPYWAWVSFACLLNFEIWRLNRPGVRREDELVVNFTPTP